MGVFATRSPFRPNRLGLSCVKIEEITLAAPEGPVIRVSGADLMNGTPIYDIKPYLPYADCVPEAAGGFTEKKARDLLRVEWAPGVPARVPGDVRTALADVLAQDPRPSYQHDPDRVYGLAFGGFNVRFRVDGDVLTVTDVEEKGAGGR